MADGGFSRSFARSFEESARTGGIFGRAAEGLQKRKERRQGEAVRDAILRQAQSRKVAEQRAQGLPPTGLSEETVKIFEKIKGTPREILQTAKDLGLTQTGQVTTPERIQQVAQQNPGLQVTGKTAGGLTLQRTVPSTQDIAARTETQKAVELAFQPAFDQLAIDRKLQEASLLDEQEFDSQKARFQRRGDIRADFVKQSKDFSLLRDAIGKVEIAASRGSAAGDLAMIFNFMKILDPGSTVREGEQATARNARGVPDAVRNTYNRLLRGESLAPAQREDFLQTARDTFGSQVDIHKRRVEEFTKAAERAEVDPRDIILDLTVPTEFLDTTPDISQDPEEFAKNIVQQVPGLKVRVRSA